MITGSQISETVRHILNSVKKNVYQSTMFVNDKTIIRATLRRYKGKISRGKHREIILTIGPPNFRERKRIKQLKKTHQPIDDRVELKEQVRARR